MEMKMSDEELVAWRNSVGKGDAVIFQKRVVIDGVRDGKLQYGCALYSRYSVYPVDYFDPQPAGGRWVDVSSGELPNHDDFVWVQHKGGGVRQLRKSEFFCVDRWFDDGKLPGPPPIKNPRIAELRELTKLQSLALAANKAELAETEAELAKLVGGAS